MTFGERPKGFETRWLLWVIKKVPLIWRTPKGLWNIETTPLFLFRTNLENAQRALKHHKPYYEFVEQDEFGERPKGFETTSVSNDNFMSQNLENAQRALKQESVTIANALYVYLENAQRALKQLNTSSLKISYSYLENAQRALKLRCLCKSNFVAFIWRTPKGLWNAISRDSLGNITGFGERPKGFETTCSVAGRGYHNNIWRTPKGLWNSSAGQNSTDETSFGERPKGFETKSFLWLRGEPKNLENAQRALKLFCVYKFFIIRMYLENAQRALKLGILDKVIDWDLYLENAQRALKQKSALRVSPQILFGERPKGFETCYC